MVHRADTHSPEKPIETFRDFVREIVIIVIGVVIALAAGELVDDWNWKQEVAIVQDSLDDELSEAVFAARERIQIADCQRRTLDRLDQIADESRGTLGLRHTPVSRNRIWPSAAWEAAVASGAVAHMAHDDRNAYANLFSFMPLFRELNIRQQEQWARINAYRNPRAYGDEGRARFIEAIAELRSLTGTMNLAAAQFLEAAKPLKIELSEKDAATLAAPLQCEMP